MKNFEHKNKLFLVISVFFSILSSLYYYKFGFSDHIEQLPIIYRFIDDNYLVQDFFVNSNSQFSVRFYYANALAFFSNYFSIASLFLVLTFISNALLAISSYLVSFKFFKNNFSALIGATLVLSVYTINIGSSGNLFNSSLLPSAFAFPLITIAFYFLLEKKIIIALLITGFVALFHVLIGTEYAFIFLGTAILWEFFHSKNYKKIAILFTYGIIPLIFLLPTAIPYFAQNDKISSDLFIKIVAFFRHPHHYIASAILTFTELLKLGSFIVVFIILFKKWRKENATHFLAFNVKTLALFLVVLGFIGWFFVEIIPSKGITTLQLFRLFNILKWILLLFIGNFIGQFIVKKDYKKFLIAFISSINPIVFLMFLLTHPYFKKIKYKTIFAFFFLFIASYFLVKFQGKVLFLILLFGLLLLISKKEKYLPLFFIVAIFFTTINFKKTIKEKQLFSKNYLRYVTISSTKKEMVTFIKNHTAKESVFLAPHNFGFLRIYAQRALIVDFKAFPFQNQAIKEWYQRIKMLYGTNQKEFYVKYKHISDQKLTEIQKKYYFNYAILNAETNTKFPIIYKNNNYKIIKIID